MSESSSTNLPSLADVRAQIALIAHLLRHVQHLGPEATILLADLLDEVSGSLATSEMPSAEIARLTESTAHLVQAVQQEDEPGVLEAARDGMKRAIMVVEMEAPGVTNFTRRLADMLSNLGI